ncbi:MAG: rod-binding protein [Planctomycetes bacterium]|nr:rod-binding protein [Planctomycetota bacterium]
MGDYLPPPVNMNAADILKGPASALAHVGRDPRIEKAENVAKDFESVLLNKLLDSMKETIGQDDDLTGGPAVDQTYDMFFMMLAQDLARKGGLGLWKDFYKHYNLGGQPNPAGPEHSTVETKA